MAFDPWNSAKDKIKDAFKSPLGKIVAIAAAVAIPYAAPAIAGSLAATTGYAAIGGTIGSAVTGAALGAGLAGATGGNAWVGAGLGGIGGYYGASQGLRPGDAFGGVFRRGGVAPAGSATSSGAAATGAGASTGAGVGATTPFVAGPNAVITPAGTEITAGGGGGFMEALKSVPATMRAKFSDPKVLADITLKAGGMLAGSYLAGNGMTPEEQRLLNAQAGELEYLRQYNQEAFNKRMQWAQDIYGEHGYFDPQYFGLQRARTQQLAGARVKQEYTRGLTGAARDNEARRIDLGTSRNMGTSYDQGFQSGVQGRISTRMAGVNALPNDYPTTAMGGYGGIAAAYSLGERNRRQNAADVGSAFAGLFGVSDLYKRDAPVAGT